MKDKKNRRGQAALQILMVLGIAVALNVIAGLYFRRFDLTSDKRYTLSETTKRKLRELKDVAYVKVYLEGEDLRPDLRRLNQSTREILDEFRSIAGEKIQYQFIDPNKLPDEETRRNLFKQLASMGLPPMVVEDRLTGQRTEKLIIPGAVVSYGGKEMPVELYQKGAGINAEDKSLENAVIGLEYQFMNGLHKLELDKKPKIGVIQGHGELRPIQLADMVGSLSQFYQVDFVDLPRYKTGRLEGYDAIIVAKPDSFYTELEKFKIDQYVMNGGKVLWCVESLNANMDSLRTGRNETYTADYNLNLLNDFLFKYGVRVNLDIVLDANCNVIPLANNTGVGDRFTPAPWPYYPVVETPASGGHPIVNNLSPVWFQFANSIDTLSGKSSANIRKTVLLQSSQASRTALNPVRISIATAINFKQELQRGLYNQGPKTLAVLLEGAFQSAFINRISPETLASGAYGEFKDHGKPTKMIVVSDGDVIRNSINRADRMPMRLGYDQYSGQMFGNKAFLLNCVDYLLDDEGLLSLRAKDIRVRPLDKDKAESDKVGQQVKNLALPLLLITFFGIIFNYVRRRRFAK